MATVALSPSIGILFQGFTSGGIPLNGGLLYTYIAGGTTPQATYTTSVGNIQNANPIVLGSDGRPPSEVWLVSGSSYRYDLKDALGNLIKTYDNISGINDAASLVGSITLSANLNAGGFKITNLGAPTASADALSEGRAVGGTVPSTGAFTTLSVTTAPLDLSGAASGQIKFTITQNPSSNLRTLDDYEERDFSASISDGSGAGLTFSNVVALSQKVGNRVQFTINLTFPPTANANNLQINGLPYSVSGEVPVAITTNAGSAFQGLAGAVAVGAVTLYAVGSFTRSINSAFSSAKVYVGGTYTANQ